MQWNVASATPRDWGGPISLNSTLCSVTRLFAGTLSHLRDVPWASPAHTQPWRAILEEPLAPSCWTLLEHSCPDWGQWGLPRDYSHWSSFHPGENLSTGLLPSSGTACPPRLHVFLSRLNLPCSPFILPSTQFSRSFYHPGSVFGTQFGLSVGLGLDPLLQISIKFSPSITTPKITWGFAPRGGYRPA